jgi:hypothetical protein
MICRVNTLALLVLIFVTVRMQFVVAGEVLVSPASALHAVNDIEWSQMVVRIVDSDERPVAGAVVRPWAFRAASAHVGWRNAIYGSPRSVTTDEKGEATVTYPKMAKLDEEQPVFALSLTVSHQDFCTKGDDVFVPVDDQSPIPDLPLERGFRLRVAGVLPNHDRPLADCYLFVVGEDAKEPEFIRQPDGWLLSNPLPARRRMFQVVWLPHGQPPQFSQIQSWSADDAASREVRVEVRAGSRVVGKLSDDVERPIERGRVAAWCASPRLPAKDGTSRRLDAIWWSETVDIAQDGTFEFPSLPPSYLAQFFAFANDSVSAQPSDEEFETCCRWFGADLRFHPEFARHAQIRELLGNETVMTIEMEPAGQLRVKCVDPEGVPLKGIDVSAWPNGFIAPNMSSLFCLPVSSANDLRNPHIDYRDPRKNPFWTTSDEHGEALIRCLPAAKVTVGAEGVGWKSEGKDQVIVEANETAEVEITLQPLP